MVEQRVGTSARRTVLSPRVLRYAGAGAVVLAAFTVVPGGASTASATSLSAGQHAAKKFTNGNANAIAQAVKIAPRTGGLSVGIALGTSIADYHDTLAQASSQAVDLGVLGTIISVQCDSSPPLVKSSQLPQPLIAESTDGKSRKSQSTAGQSSGGFAAAAGTETVAVTKLPKSDASFSGGTVGIPGVVSIGGLQTAAHSELIPGKARLATAETQIGQLSILNGLIGLKDLTWSVTQRSGANPTKKTSFSIGGITLAGTKLPFDTASANKLFNSINGLLAQTGLHVTPPKRTMIAGVLGMSPMVIGIDNSSIGGKVVNPLFSAIQTENDTIQAALEKASCKTGSVFGAVALAQSALDGTGGLDLDLGGVTASSAGVPANDPFGHQPPLGNGDNGNNQQQTPPSTKSNSGGPTIGDNGGGSSLPNTSSTGSGPPSGGGGAPTVAGQQVVSTSCATTSPANRPNCSKGQGLAVGLIGLGALAAVGGSDFFISRRRRRVPRQALQL